MSVGGIVVCVLPSEKPGNLYIETIDRGPHLPDGQHGTRCVVELVPIDEQGNAVEIRPNDSLWWQDGYCYWTRDGWAGLPRKEGDPANVKLRKIGYSHGVPA